MLITASITVPIPHYKRFRSVTITFKNELEMFFSDLEEEFFSFFSTLPY